MDLSPTSNILPEGYVLHWYEIIRVIGHGGFGITYLAKDKNLDIQVAIKEFLPSDFANRHKDFSVHPRSEEQSELYNWGLDRFISEARTLAKFQHPNIVRVLSVFEQNHTAYMVMEYAEGQDLSHVYKKNPRFSEEQFLDTFIPILDGLALIHSENFIHRDIKPANIYICNNNAPLLLDFGSARQSIGHKTKALTSLVTYGYAPFEQYNEGTGKQGPWSDIYALGASLYVGITGQKPIDALARGGSLLETGFDIYQPISVIAKGEFSENFLLAIDHALMFKIEDRPKNVLKWAEMLLAKSKAPALPEFMLQKPSAEHEETVALPWGETSLEETTAPSKGTQGLVDSRGKRSPTIKESNKTRVISPRSTEFHAQVVVRKSKKPLIITVLSMVLVVTIITIWMFSGGENQAPKNSLQIQSNTIPAINNSAVQTLNAQTQQALLNKQLLSPEKDNAFYYATEALKLEANNTIALKNIKNIEQKISQLANSNYLAGNYPQARHYIKQLIQLNPRSITAKTLQKNITQQLQKNVQLNVFNEHLTRAKNHFNKQEFIAPEGNNALYFYQQAALIKANDSRVVNGFKKIEKLLLLKTKTSIKQQQLALASRYLQVLKKINPNSIDVISLQNQLKKTSTNQRKITQQLSHAQSLLKKKRYTKPANDNAYTIFKNILKSSPNNKTALNGINKIQNYYKKQFSKNIINKNFKQAKTDLDNFKTVNQNKNKIRNMQAKLKREKSLTSKIKQQPEIETISLLLETFKKAITRSDSRTLNRISQYQTGRRNFVKTYTQQYKKAHVNISGFRHIAQQHKAFAKVSLTKLVNKNNQQVNPGGWGNFEVKIQKNTTGQFKIIW